MASKKKSASQIAAENEYYAKHNINVPQKPVEPIELLLAVQPIQPPGLKEFGEYISSISIRPIYNNMEDKEIIPALIKRYESVLNTILGFTNDPLRIKSFLNNMRCDQGVCYASRAIFGTIVNERKWVKENLKGNKVYWWEIAKNCYTSNELIACISFRLDRLTEILNSLP